ncbi:MAG: hypothetical protein ACP5O1_10580, partial [Phycisphaerae bacterium]
EGGSLWNTQGSTELLWPPWCWGVLSWDYQADANRAPYPKTVAHYVPSQTTLRRRTRSHGLKTNVPPKMFIGATHSRLISG